MYGKPFNFRMLNGYSTHRSILGALVTMFSVATILVYAATRIQVLARGKESKIDIWQYE